MGVGDYLLDRAIHRDNLKVKKETKIYVLSRMMKRKVFCYSAFLYASEYKMVIGGRCFVWDDLRNNMIKEWREAMGKRAVQKGTYGLVEGQGENVFKIDIEKMRALRLMFDLCLDGMSLGQIKDVIEAQGVLYPAKYKKDTNGIIVTGFRDVNSAIDAFSQQIKVNKKTVYIVALVTGMKPIERLRFDMAYKRTRRRALTNGRNYFSGCN